MASTEGVFALVVYRYRGPDESYLDVHPGSLVVVWRVEPNGWAGALDLEGGWGWIPLGYVRPIDDETVAVLEPIAQQLRLGAFRAMTAIQATSTDPYEGYSSPDSNESDTLGDEWTHIPKQRRSSRAVSRPREMDKGTPRASLDDEPVPPVPRQGVQFATSSPPPTSFVPRVRAFRLRSKSRDGTRSDSEPTRTRRPSVSLRRTRVSMFGAPREPNPAEQIARLAARPWYLQPLHSPTTTGDIIIDPDGSVRAGTLQAIAERLTCDPPSRSYELALRRAVLLTYEAYTTSQHLFDLITDQYSLDPPRELDQGQFLEWKEVRLRPTQARVLDVLGMWLDLPRLYQDDPELVSRIRDFLKLVTEPDSLASEARAHLRTISKLVSPPVQYHPPSPQRQRRRAPKQRPFPTLSPGHSHSPSGNLLSPASPRVSSPHPGLAGHTSPVQGYSSPVQRAASPRLGFSSPRGGASSPSPSHGTSSPSLGLDPSITSTSMTSLPSALGPETSPGLARAKSHRHASASYSKQTESSHALSSDWSYVSSSSSSGGLGNRPSGVLLLDPTALAHHLTLLESSLYMRVKRIQCLEWHKAGKNAPKSGEESQPEETNDLRAFCSTSDKLAGWVKWSILSLDSPNRRAEAAEVWIRVAEKCRLVNNTSSLSAIVAGLSSADVSRLPHTWHLVNPARASRLETLSRLTSPLGGFAALKVVYASPGCGVPFVGMYLTSLVHAADQFKDYVPALTLGSEKGKETEVPRREEHVTSEPATPTQTTRSRLVSTPRARTSIDSTSLASTASSIISHASPSVHRDAPPSPSTSTSGSRAPSSPTTSTLPPPSSPTNSTVPQKLLNFTKRHKQAEIIGTMLKFQAWPYTVAPVSTEGTSTPSPSSSTTKIYPYPPPQSSSITINASAGGVAWVEEQLARAATITLNSDWTYERSLKLYEEETGGRGGGVEKDFMSPAGF